MTRTTELAIVATIVLFSSAARADDEVDPASLRAEALAADAETRVANGAWADAVALYIEAYRVAPAAVIAFDIAWLYDEKLNARDLAVAYYEKCVASPDVEPALAARARERIAVLRAPAVATEPTRAPKSDARSSWSPAKTWAVALGGAGVVALGVGVGFGLVAKSKDDEASTYCDGDRCTDARAISLTEDATRAARAANVAFIAAGALLAGGAVLWFVAPKKSAPAIGAQGTSIVLRGTWR